MLAKVTVPPFSSLTETQQLVVTALRGKSKTTHQLKDELKRNYSVVNRAVNDLRGKEWVEVDLIPSGGRERFWKLKQIPSDAIEVMMDNGIKQESYSFNRYFESVAKQLSGGLSPKLARELERYFKAIATLGYYAALEFTSPGSVGEAQLLEERSAIQSFVRTLEENYSIATQFLENERVWHANTLADGVMRKTDRYLTPGDMARYAKGISDSFASQHTTEDEFETEEETDSAND